MNQDFYHRDRELHQEQDRHNSAASKHQTLETVQLEQDAAQEGVPAAASTSETQPGFFTRLKRKVFG